MGVFYTNIYVTAIGGLEFRLKKPNKKDISFGHVSLENEPERVLDHNLPETFYNKTGPWPAAGGILF